MCGSCTVWQEDSAGPVSLQAKEGLAPLQAQLDRGADPFAAVAVPGKASVQFNLGHQEFHASAELMAMYVRVQKAIHRDSHTLRHQMTGGVNSK